MLDVGEMWREAECDGCGAERAVLDVEMYKGYDQGPKVTSFCAQCLRDLASDLDKFEAQANDED
jgi:hypothetical protein